MPNQATSNSYVGGEGLGVAAGVITSLANIYATSRANQAQREWNEQMYNQQRSDAMTDWLRQNEYNSPQATMARLRAAGLNPNLVYGNGATTTAGPIRSTETKSYNPQVPDYGGLVRAPLQALGASQDYALQNEQIKNMQAQRANMQLDSILKGVEIASNNISNARSTLELSKARELYDTTVETAKEQLRSISTGTDVKVSQEVRNAAMHAPNLLGAFERVANISANTDVAKQQLDNLKKTGVLQDMEIKMRKLGLSYNDGVILRMLAQFAGGQSLPDVVKNLWSYIQSLAGPGKDVIDVK